MHVVTAGVHHRHVGAVRASGGRRAGIRQIRRLPHGQPVHVGPEQHRGPVTVAQDAHHARAADPLVDLEPGGPQPLGDPLRGAPLLV
jgi:hypothetical protein